MNKAKYKITIGASALCLILAFVAFGQPPNPSKTRNDKMAQAIAFYREADRLSQEDTAESLRAALEKYEQAWRLYNELKDKYVETTILTKLGEVSFKLGEHQKAIEYFSQALSSKTTDTLSGALILNKIAIIYSYLGENQKALEYYTKVLSIMRSKNKFAEAVILQNIGTIYLAMGEKQKAFEYLNQALTIYRLSGNGNAEGIILGKIFLDAGDYKKALEYENQSLQFFRDSKNKRREANVLRNIGEVYYHLRENQKAVDYYNQALSLHRLTGDKRAEAKTLQSAMLALESLSNRQLAIIYGKQSVNLYQELRQAIKGLDEETQNTYLKTVEPTYRKLAEILISEGRLPEAQTVLDLLKEEEYEQLKRSGETSDTVPYSQTEADVITKIENLVTLERERAELQKQLSTNGELSAEQNDKLTKLNLDIAAANKAFDVALDALGKAQASATTRVDEIKGGKVLQSALTELSEKTNSGVVALYTVLGTEEDKDALGKPIKDKLKSKFGWVIMVTENRYTAYPIDVENLEDTVFQFRAALSSDKYNPQPLAEKIYTAIFRQTSPKLKKTLEQDLQEYLKSHTDKTLMWSLDGVLRYIPMAALHDGKQYLVENYQTTVFTKESFVWLMNSYENNWKALGLGVSDKRPNFDALPGVKTELETIVREPDKPTGILNGSIKLNDNFKKQTFFNIINAGGFPVVHISSHYSFDSGKPENSFLLAGDGNLTFAEIKEQQNLFKKVDLLTLSACDTGVSGNGKEAEGFAYLAQSLGAKSVIASLWKVSDAGTPELMTRFYQSRKDNPNLSKGEAFRRAQISLLGSEVKDAVSQPTVKIETKVTTPNQKRTDVIDLSGKTIELPLFVKDKQKPFSHPHYWASFVLIGNWR